MKRGQGAAPCKRSLGRTLQKDITDTFGSMTAASRVAEDRHQFRKTIMQGMVAGEHLGSDVLTRICSEREEEVE